MQDFYGSFATYADQLSQLLAAIPIGVTVHDRTGQMVHINPVAQKLFGIQTFQPIQLSNLPSCLGFYRLGSGQVYPVEELPIVRSLIGESAWVEDLELRQAERAVLLKVSTTPICDASSSVEYVIAIFQAITEPPCTQTAVQVSEAVPETNSQGKTGYVGMTTDLTNPRQLAEALPTDLTDRKRVEQLLSDYNRVLEQQIHERTLALAIEINERQQAEETLRQQQDFLRTVIDNAPIYIFVKDWEGRILLINRAAAAFYDKPIEEMIGKRDVDLHPSPEAVEPFLRQNQYVIETGQPLFIPEERAGQAIDCEEWLQWQKIPLRPPGSQDICVLGIGVNITAHKHIEAKLAEANRELQRLVHLDGLTHVANRRRFDEYLEQRWQQGMPSSLSPQQPPISLILCDIDCFKAYNDFYGHLAGDDCLIQVAQAMHHVSTRSGDLVARYGGEEFVVILPHTDGREALHVAQQIRRSVHDLQIPHARSTANSVVSLSIGLSSVVPTADTSPNLLVALADQALYEAKRQGRDRVIVINSSNQFYSYF